jgi:Cu(I)/Ag(I) efflux system protein CusF
VNAFEILEHIMKTLKIAAAALAATLATAIGTTDVLAQSTALAASSATSSAMSEGEVRKIDKEQGKVTLRHGPIQNLGMPGMTMVFKVADPKMLETMKEGDKVRFKADRVNGAITVVAIEPA